MVSLPLQEMGGDYGIQRFVGNFGAIVFAPLGGYVIDQASTDTEVDFSPAIYIYLVLKLMAGVFIHSIFLIAFSHIMIWEAFAFPFLKKQQKRQDLL